MDGSLHSRLLGTWELVESTATLGTGETVHPLGRDARGRATFGSDGVLTVQIGRADRERFASDERSRATPEETHQAFLGYLAYYGHYTVDEAAGTFSTRVDACLFPNWEGTVQTRRVTFDGEFALFTTPPRELPRGGVAAQTLRWRRAPPSG
jgi:hypothetical protein